MLCKAVNKARGVNFYPPVDYLADPLATLQACTIAFASEVHTGQIEVVADKEFADTLADKEDAALVKREPPQELSPGLTFAYTYDNVPVLVTG